MAELLHIRYPIVVEGKYDKIRLAGVTDAHVITTEGFGVFSNSELVSLIRRLASGGKIIVLTDSDRAGRQIRSRIGSILPAEKIINLYIPAIPGKEKRKIAPSKEGTLGVEGMGDDVLRGLLSRFADGAGAASDGGKAVTKTDFFVDGFSGGANASVLRDALAKRLDLPPGMTANALLGAVNILCTYEEYKNHAKALKDE